MRLFKILFDGISIFRKNACFNLAAAISFYAFFSLIPVLIFIVAALGFVMGGSAGLLDKVVSIARENLPYFSTNIVNDLTGISKSWKTFGWISIVLLLVSAETVFNAAAGGLIAIFDMKEGYDSFWGFFRRKVVNVLVFLSFALSAFVSIAVTAGAKLALKADTGYAGVNAAYHFIVFLLLKTFLPFALMTLSVTLVYRMFSGTRLNLRYAFYGALCFTVLWEAGKQVFAWYVLNFPSYNKIYGSLGAIMMLLLWFFYSANIFLLSASFTVAAYRNKGKGR